MLSVEEMDIYFGSIQDMIGVATEYAMFNGILYDEETGQTSYWLRTPGYSNSEWYYSAYQMQETGECSPIWVGSSLGGIRPAMWVDLSDVS